MFFRKKTTLKIDAKPQGGAGYNGKIEWENWKVNSIFGLGMILNCLFFWTVGFMFTT